MGEGGEGGGGGGGGGWHCTQLVHLSNVDLAAGIVSVAVTLNISSDPLELVKFWNFLAVIMTVMY